MSTTDIASLIERLAARYIGWQDPREAVREPRRGCLAVAKLPRISPRVAGGRRSEVKEEGRAQPGPGDMSSVGHPPPSACADLQRTRRLMRREWREARWGN